MDPIRNLFFRLFAVGFVKQMWIFNSVFFVCIGIGVFLILKKIIPKDSSKYLHITYCSLLFLFNLSFIRLIHGTQNFSIMIGIMFFVSWQTLMVYFPNKSKFYIFLLVLSSWSNLLLFPLVLFGVIQDYLSQKVKRKLVVLIIVLIAIVPPLYQKYLLLNEDIFYLLGNPVSLSSYIDFSYTTFTFKNNLIGLFGAMGKLIIPFGTRQWYLQLTINDFLGFLLILIFISVPLYKLKTDKLIKLSTLMSIVGLILLSLMWPILYRKVFLLDKLTGFQFTTTTFFQGINNDDLISFYIIAFLPLLILIKNNVRLKRGYFVLIIFFQTFVIGSYAPKLFQTKAHINSQLKFEPEHDLLNLSLLFYASENKEKYNQNELFEHKVKIDRSENMKLKVLGNFFYGSILQRYDTKNKLEVSLEEIEQQDFHPWLMIQVYLYFQKFQKVKKAQVELITDQRLDKLLRKNSLMAVEAMKYKFYWDTLYYLAYESVLNKKKEDAISYLLQAYVYANSEDEKKQVATLLAKVTNTPLNELIESELTK